MLAPWPIGDKPTRRSDLCNNAQHLPEEAPEHLPLVPLPSTLEERGPAEQETPEADVTDSEFAGTERVTEVLGLYLRTMQVGSNLR